MEGNSLNNNRKEKKHKSRSSTERYLDSNVTVSEDSSLTKIKKKRKREKDHSSEREVTVKVEVKGHEDENSYANYELDTLSIKNKKKKKKREKIDESNVHSNGNIVDINVENQLQYTNSQLLDIDYSTDNVDTSTKKKKKKKHKDRTENTLSDQLPELKTEGEVKVEVKSEVMDFDTRDQELSISSSNELHVKKGKKRHKHSEYDEVHHNLNDSNSKPEKIKEEEIKDESNIDAKSGEKSKKNKHKKEVKNETVEVDFLLEEKTYIQENDDLESSLTVKNKKKKHKKHSDNAEIDVVEGEIDTTKTELSEFQQKKKKKKKHSKELSQESEPVHRDSDYVDSDQKNIKENHVDSHNYEKKKKKDNRRKKAVETDCDSPKKRYKKMEMILQEESSMKDKTDKQPEESSGFESEEDDYSESERIPRMSKTKPSIFTKYPRLARIMQDSDSDDNYPHLQHRKLTLTEAVKLLELEIKLRHEPPPQHQIEKYPGTCTLTPEEKKKFMEYCELRSGRFTYEEDQRIVHNWKKFCKTHGWRRSVIYPFLHQTRKGFFYVASVEGRKKFVQFLAKGLPNRSLYSVYTRFRNLYATHKTTRYTKEEDEVIMNELKDHHGRNRFSVVGRKLNRTRASVWRRYKLLLAKRKENSDNEDEKTNESIAN